MKHVKTITLLALSSALLLAGCDKSLSKEAFMDAYNQAKEYTQVTNTDIKNVHIQNKLGNESYNYKEGEFYSHKLFALLLIVPITTDVYTWKEDGKFYYAERHTDSKKNIDKEITEEQFNTYMEGFRVTLFAKLAEPFVLADNLLSDNQEGYKEVSNKYKKTFKGAYSLVSKVTNEQENTTYDENNNPVTTVETKTTNYNLEFKNNLPAKYYSKVDKSETTWTYTYGKAELKKPSTSSENSGE